MMHGVMREVRGVVLVSAHNPYEDRVAAGPVMVIHAVRRAEAGGGLARLYAATTCQQGAFIVIITAPVHSHLPSGLRY